MDWSFTGTASLVDSPLPPYRKLVGTEAWEASEQLRMLRLDPSLVPGYALESYDIGVLFDEIEAAGPLWASSAFQADQRSCVVLSLWGFE